MLQKLPKEETARLPSCHRHSSLYAGDMQAVKPQRSEQDESLLQRFEAVHSTFAQHRPPARDAALIVVTKTFSLARITPLLSHGHRHFGENRVQEASDKWEGVRDEYPDLCLHAVGALQSNKVVPAVRLFDVIHSLDRPRLAYALAEATAKLSKRVVCFVQVNIGCEEQKAGVALEELESFLRLAREDCALPVAGLMCLPPHGKMPAPYFALLANLAREHGLSQLSMGMSADYAEALTFGATHIRVGSAIMGARALSFPFAQDNAS